MSRKRYKIIISALLSVFVITLCGCGITYTIVNNMADNLSDSEENKARSNSKADTVEEPWQPDFKDIDIVVDDICYYYKQLSAEDQLTYRRLLDGILNEDYKILLEETDGDAIDRVMQAMLYDNPQIFWCDGTYEYITYTSYMELFPTYNCTGDELAAKKKEIDKEAAIFLSGIDETATDYDKVRTVYEYVIESVDYEEGVPYDQNIYSSIVNKKSVCAGYAREVQYLLQKMDIECIYVIGTVIDGGDHGWNIVKCSDQYYQVDATYGDRDFLEESSDTEESDAETEDTTPEELQINYSYLCSTDAQLYANRQVDSVFEVPVCSSDDLNYYKQIDCYFEDYTEEVLNSLETSVFQGEKVWECQFAYAEDYQEMLTDVENGVHGDIVGDYLEQSSFVGEYYTWYSYNDEMYTIACWY